MSIYKSLRPLPYVYMCIHKITGQFYFGYREQNVSLNLTSDEDFPLYKTSSKTVNPNFDEYDWHIIAEFFNGNDAYDFEQQLISNEWGNPLLLNESCYYGKARFNHANKKHTESAKQKISKSKIGKPLPKTEETKLKMSNTWKRIAPDRSGEKNPMFGKKQSDTTKKKISIANKGKKKSEYPRLECPHCGVVGISSNIKRWHLDNCKKKDINGNRL